MRKTISEKFHWNWDGKKYRTGNVHVVIEDKDYSYRFLWMTSNWLKEKLNLSLVWKKLMKLVDLGEPTSFLDDVYLGCAQRECKPNESVIEECRKMFDIHHPRETCFQ